MQHYRIYAALGLAGVAPDENPLAQRWDRRLEWPMLLMACWLVLEWYLSAQHVLPAWASTLTEWGVWLFFCVETLLLQHLVHDRGRFLRSNWLTLAIILVGIPSLVGGYDVSYLGGLRILRLLVMIRILLPMVTVMRQVLAHNNLGATLLTALVFIIMGGTGIAIIDPAIETPWDGIWWAWITVTTVGYGDVVPTSGAGKLFGSLLILLGIGLVSMLTASLSVFLLAREEEKVISKEAALLDQLERIEQRLERLERRLERLSAGAAATSVAQWQPPQAKATIKGESGSQGGEARSEKVDAID